MLSMMRRHVGWGLKVLLAVTIVTFVFFFGYTTIRQQTQEDVALKVGKETIAYGQYDFFYQNQLDRFKEKFKEGEIPPFVLESIRQSTQRLLAQRSLTKQFAKQLGLTVTDAELALAVTEAPDFDPVAYKNYLQNFFRQYGFSYEEAIRDDLWLKKFTDWASRLEPPAVPLTQPQWTFETLTLRGEEKKALAETILSLWAKGQSVKALLAKEKLETQTVGPISLARRKQLFFGQLERDDYLRLFALSKKGAALDQPLRKGEQFFLARLVEKKAPAEQEASLPWRPQVGLIDFWFQQFAQTTKIQSHIAETQP